MAEILSSGGFKPTTLDQPLDVRSRVATEADIMNIENPHVGLLVRVLDTGKWYEITALQPKAVGGVTINNAAVATYTPFGGSGAETEDRLVELEKSLEDIQTAHGWTDVE